MRDKMVFFTLGVLLATFAYFMGDLSNISALEDPTFEKLTVDSLVAKTIVVTEDADKSLVGIMVKDNIPSINMVHRDGIVENSAIMLTAVSDTDLSNVGSSSIIRLSGKNGKPAYLLTHLGGGRE